jgi:hypothetical protein
MVPMNRLGNKFFSSVLAAATALSLAACGGGASHASPGAAVPATAADYTGPLADATLKITIPGPSTNSQQRSPRYISSATKSLKFVINSSTTVSGAALTAYNARPWHLFDTGTLPNATCPAAGPNFNCTVVVKLPPGTDNVTFSAYDNTGGTGNLLSQQIQNLTVVAGIANSFGVTFDANLGVMTVSGSGSCQAGPVGAAFGSVGTTPVNFTVAFTDPATKTIVAPGKPVIQIQDNTATYQSTSGTINGTGGTIGFSINQAAQSFTLTPNNSSTTNASVNVKAVPANSTGSSDGLAFGPVKTFAFSTGPAPPSHNFLAAVEQTGVGTGKVDFFNITLDGSLQPAGFTAFNPASLTATVSTNDATQNDVDNPVSLQWDSTGDLLIGNGGSSGNGNLACVPVGAIATGANSSTTVTTNIHDPVGIAYETRNGTVAIGNNANNGTAPLAEYVLTGNYTASTTAGATNMHNAMSGTIGGSLINMPSLATGTFAATLTDGCEVELAHRGSCTGSGTSQVVLFNASGITTTMSDASTFHIDEPWGITWESANSQLIIANNSAWHPSVSFYTTAGTYVKNDGHDYFGASQNPYMVAANGTGLFAVAYTTAIAGEEVQIYTNAAGGGAPVPLFGPIPYDAQSNSGCTGAYVYGPSAVVTSLVWLSSTRLLVGLETSTASANGYYIYDTASSTTPAQWDFGNGATCVAVGAIPAQKAFQQITNKPFAAAYKP